MNWYKLASRLISVPLKGTLKQTDEGFVYLNISNDVVHGLFKLIDEEGIEEPPYDRGKYKKIGAHISVINGDEIKDKDLDIKEIGEEFNFELGEFYSTKPDSWKEMERVWFVSVISPELEKLRESYGLSKKINSHEFHFTCAVRRK